MKISELLQVIEIVAPPALQEDYDNAGLITGDASWECTGVLCTLDATVAVIEEAIEKKCNLVVAHHPIVFKGLKRINGRNYVEQVIIKAIKNDIAIYAAHTNLDNVLLGVNNTMAQKLGLKQCSILAPKPSGLRKLITFAPIDKAAIVRDALFTAGAGSIGQYSECSFNAEGLGTFNANEGATPYVGDIGQQHAEKETKIEVIYPFYIESKVIQALLQVHPYEEVAYDLLGLHNQWATVGAGIIGELATAVTEEEFLVQIQRAFHLQIIRHTPLRSKLVKKVALCGGAGSFLIKKALAAGADFYITADVKYHEFFDAEGKMVLADIGHYESEQFTVDLLSRLLVEKFPTFAVLKTTVDTNPLRYYK